MVFDQRCRPLWDETVMGLESRFDVRLLCRTRILQFVTMQALGDGTLYMHQLLVMRGGTLRLLTEPVGHTGKDGFYLGPLARGEGMVTWIADPAGESEADGHPYVVRVWRWRRQHLVPSSEHETSRRYAATPDGRLSRPDAVARAMGLPYHDQTGVERFADPARVIAHEGEPAGSSENPGP